MASYRWRIHVITSASVFYFFTFPETNVFSILLAVSVCLFVGKGIGENQDALVRKRYLLVGLGLLIVNLVFSKYSHFFCSWIVAILGYANIRVNIQFSNQVFPTGISFYTFLAIGYLVDVYRGDFKAESRISYLTGFIVFFPKFLAGPIERSRNFLTQLHDEKGFVYWHVTAGMKLVSWGLFKKLIVANRAAVYVDAVYSNPEQHVGWSVIFAFYLYAIQIYCDFSGYTDIALGSARMLGFKLIENFRRPFLARSIKDFWRRWHISLTSWLRDYLYIPLGGNRTSLSRWRFNIMAVFILSGIWHGPNVTFWVWGCIHGMYYIIEDLLDRLRARSFTSRLLEKAPLLGVIAGIVITFHLVAIAWVPFRSESISQALSMLHQACQIDGTFKQAFNVIPQSMLIIIVLGTVIVTIVEVIQEIGYWDWIRSSRLRWVLYYLLVMTLICFSYSGSDNDFIYGRF